MHRFFPVRHVQLAKPGNSRNQLGRMLAVDSDGCFLAVSAYEDRFAVLSVSMSAGSDIIDKTILYPSENEGETYTGRGLPRISIRGTIWSMSFISKDIQISEDEHNCVLAIVMHRRGAALNDLLLFGCNSRESTVHIIAQYSESGPLSLGITEVPHLSGFAFLFRMGDILLMDLRDPGNPCCIHKISVNTAVVEDHCSADESCRGIDVDDEGIFKVAARALLKLRDSGDDMVIRDDPMSIDSGNGEMNSTCKFVSSWSWEPSEFACPKLITCLDTGELFMLEIHSDLEGVRVDLSNCLYRVSPCKVLLWVEGGLIAALVEMGDGVILKLEHGKLLFGSPIQNISPILDLCLVDYNGEKQDQIYACCGMCPEGSLRITRSGISVERLLTTAPIYKGITGTWTLRMKESDSHHSFLVLSFVEGTRVLSVGLSFIDVSDSVGFQTDVCTLACGLLADGLLVQIHRTEVRLALPAISAHPEGIPLSLPVSASWYPGNMTISLGAVGHNFIVIATSNPCFLFILGVRLLSTYQYEINDVHHVRLQNEVSCISIPREKFKQGLSGSIISVANKNCEIFAPTGVEIGKTFVVGTHKPSVEIMSFSLEEGCRVLAVGSISINNTFGTPLSGCIPEDVKIVSVDRFYVLAGLRNGMLLRFEWPTVPSVFHSGIPMQSSLISISQVDNSLSSATISCTTGLQNCSMQTTGDVGNSVPVVLQLIALRRIGITPVFLVPLHDSLNADMIALSDRPWLLQTARHSLSYTSVSFQSATHVTPVNTIDCPKGILFVAENSLHLVEMAHSTRLNVQKFCLGGTPRKVLYHNESKTLLVMRSGLSDDSCSSDICRIDPLNGSLLSRFKCEHGEIAKSMQIVKVGTEQVLVVGTSQIVGRAIMPSGESESSAKGRLIVISLEKMQMSDDSYLAICSNTVPSQITCPFREIVGYATEQLSSSSLCSSPDDNSYDGVQLDKMESGQLRPIACLSMPGVVLSVCSYLDRYVLASAGSFLYVCGFLNDNPHRLRRFTSVKSRFMITCLTTYFTRIAVGDCRDGILFYTYQEDLKKLEQLYCDPVQRLVADCALVDPNTAVVSDRRGNVSILSSPNDLEDNPSPECNLRLRCSYYMGETIMSIRKGSFLYKLPVDDVFKSWNDGETIPLFAKNSIMAGTLLGSVMTFVPITSEEHELLKVVQARLAVHPWTAPILGNDHAEFRGRGSPAGAPTILDGDMLAQFLELTSMQQEAVLAPFCTPNTIASSSKPFAISIDRVVRLLERVHYALN
uniref:Splicing factor 3B subunit 3 n=2 Tax=Anthurium amnicola TaxID=1678845 RepID=A0A1D1Y3V3_9ARAE